MERGTSNWKWRFEIKRITGYRRKMKSRTTREMNSAVCENLQPTKFTSNKNNSLPTAMPTKQKTKNYEKAYLSEKICQEQGDRENHK